MEKGYLQVYTGEGKGKTTAALGLALRASGKGLKVVMFQFLKGVHTAELDSALLLGGRLNIIRLGETKKFFGALSKQERQELKEQLAEEIKQVHALLAAPACDLIILDEVFSALHASLITLDELLAIVDARPAQVEMVLTGRNAPPEIIEKADLVTEMRCIKHYYEKGVPARHGIEK